MDKFLSPVYPIAGLGFDYHANNRLTCYVSPLTMKSTIVLDSSLSSQGVFGLNPGQKLRSEMEKDLDKDDGDKSFPMKPQRILADVRKVMNGEDILLSDVGAHKMWVARHYDCTDPNTCLISNGFCTMGFALPGSIGAKMAFPEKKVISINGDAGFFMNVQDLETAVRYKINVVAVVWLDGEYGLIKWKQQVGFKGEHSDLKFNNPNFEMLAKSLNMWGKQVSNSEEFYGFEFLII